MQLPEGSEGWAHRRRARLRAHLRIIEMDRNLALEAVRVTEAAALASARLMGRGDVAATDRAGAEAMRKAFRSIAINGVVAIGEGERGRAARCSTAAKRVGNGSGPEIDVALDPLEGATICATGGFNALSIIAFAERGGFLRCPDTYMEKIVVGRRRPWAASTSTARRARTCAPWPRQRASTSPT